MLDTLGRRIRFRPPTPVGTLQLRERDYRIFELINEFGPLPSHYIRAFVGGDLSKFLNRLGQLYDHAYLTRPPEYWECFNAGYQALISDLGDKAIALLKEKIVKRRDHAIHRLMTACVMASIKLACQDSVRFIPRNEVTEGNLMRLKLSSGYLEPDDVFGLHLLDKKEKHYYMVEVDRGTEQLQSAISRETLEGKFKNYEEVVERRLYEEAWGRKNMHILISTTSRLRAENMKNGVVVKGQAVQIIPDRIAKRVHFDVREGFATPWRMPPIYTDILDGLL